MIKRSLFCSSALALVLSASAQGDDVKFQLKFEPGKVYLTGTEMTQSATMPLGGQQLQTTSKIKMTSSQTVTKADPGVTVVQKMDTMMMDMDAAGMKVSFDSENPAGPMAAVVGPMLDTKTTMNLGPDGEVISVEAVTAPGLAALGLGEDEVKQAARELNDLMANKVVSEGESWTATTKLPTGGITAEPVTIHYTLTFDSMVEKEGRQLAKVLLKGKVAENDDEFQVTAKELGGEMLFDPEIGQPREFAMIVDIEIGLPEGAEVAEGQLGKMPMRTETISKLKEIK